MVQNFLKRFWWQFLVPRSECFLISSATLSCIYAIFQLFQCYYYKKFFSEKFLYFFSCTGLVTSLIKVLATCFWAQLLHFVVSLFYVPLYFITSKYSFFQKDYLGMVPTFPDISSSWSVSLYTFSACKHFPYHTLALSALIVLRILAKY